MTDQELIARLRGDHPDYLTATAADRIEELMKERDEERTKRKMAEGLAGLSSADIDGHSAMITVARDAVAKRIAAEAKLAKAVEALRCLEIAATGAGVHHPQERKILHEQIALTRTALAELEEK